MWCDFDVIRSAQFSGRPEKMMPALAEHGIAGVVSPIPAQYLDAWCDICGDEVAPVAFVAPESPPEYMQRIAERTKGFLYLIGVHASPTSDTQDTVPLVEAVAELRMYSPLPIIMGAGIETAAQASLAGASCDGIATAKAMFATVRTAEEAGRDPVAAVAAKVREFRGALEAAAV